MSCCDRETVDFDECKVGGWAASSQRSRFRGFISMQSTTLNNATTEIRPAHSCCRRGFGISADQLL